MDLTTGLVPTTARQRQRLGINNTLYPILSLSSSRTLFNPEERPCVVQLAVAGIGAGSRYWDEELEGVTDELVLKLRIRLASPARDWFRIL